MNRFAKFWDLYANSGDFPQFMAWLKGFEGSFFWNFMKFVDYLSEKYSETHSISLINLAEKAYDYVLMRTDDSDKAFDIIKADFCDGAKKRDIPPFMKAQAIAKGVYEKSSAATTGGKKSTSLNSRQVAHLS